MKRIRSLDVFDGSFIKNTGEVKPVMIVTVDRGLDDNPRYTKTIKYPINYFVTEDLAALLLATNAHLVGVLIIESSNEW